MISLSSVRSPVLVARQREVAAIDRALLDVRAGPGRVVVVSGEPGIGKSRLVAEFQRIAGLRGATFAVGRAAASASWPLRMWADALLALLRDRARPTDSMFQPYLGVVGLMVPHWRGPQWVAPNEPPVVIGEAILRVLVQLADDVGPAGIALALEDLHWADESSIEVLAYVASHLDDVPVTLLLTTRPEGEARVRSATASTSVIDLELQRLDHEQISEMVRACTSISHREIDAAGIADLACASRGVPLIVEDLLTAGVSGPAPRYAEIIRGKLDLLPASVVEALQAAAVLGEHVDWGIVTHAIFLDESTAVDVLAAARRADLLVVDTTVRFRHALTRDAVASSTRSDVRRMLAHRLAASCSVLLPPGALRELRVAELLETGERPREAIAVLRAFMQDPAATTDLTNALAAAEHAYRLGRALDDATAIATSVELLRLLVVTGQHQRSLDHGAVVLGRCEGRDRLAELRVRTLIIRSHLALGSWDDAERDVATARLLASGSSAELAVLEAEAALGSDRPGQRARTEHLAAKAVALAKTEADPRLECDAYLVAGRTARLRDLDAAAAALTIALRVAEVNSLGIERFRVLDELGTVEMLRDARTDRLERAYHEARARGALGAAMSAGLNLASACVMTGQHARAAQLAADVELLTSRLGVVPLRAACALIAGIAASFENDRSLAETQLARAEALAPDDSDLRTGVWAIGHGIGALIDDDRDRARRAFTRSRALSPERHARILDAALGPTLLLDALAGTIDAPSIRVASEHEVRGARWSMLWLGAAEAVALEASGDGERAGVCLVDALRAGERYPLFSALVRRLVADAFVSIDAPFSAVELLRDAAAGFEQLGLMRPLAATNSALKVRGVAAPRRRTSDRPVDEAHRRAGITAREADVLDLLAERLTNREIASRLYVSPKTIEKHVAALARKLGVTRRTELAELARTHSRR